MTLTTPAISWNDSGELFSEQFADIYFSKAGGLDEKEHVFFHHNHLPVRFATTEQLIIAETGFGTGLNFLVTLKNWLSINPAASWHYISVEKHPLSKAQLTTVYKLFKTSWPQLEPFCTEVLSHYPSFDKDSKYPARYDLYLFAGKVRLTLLIGDVNQQLAQLTRDYFARISAWYLDGFAPSKNPSMWQQQLFDTIALLSKKGTTISTYTVAGTVRRGLVKAGFTIYKTAGFGLKREMIYGKFDR